MLITLLLIVVLTAAVRAAAGMVPVFRFDDHVLLARLHVVALPTPTVALPVALLANPLDVVHAPVVPLCQSLVIAHLFVKRSSSLKLDPDYTRSTVAALRSASDAWRLLRRCCSLHWAGAVGIKLRPVHRLLAGESRCCLQSRNHKTAG
jgi:hypothetical protein